MSERVFRVRAMGQGRMADTDVNGRRFLTREDAWATVKAWKASGAYHTVRVYRGRDQVWFSIRDGVGAWHDEAVATAAA